MNTTTTIDNTTIVRDFYTALANQDVVALERFLANDVVWTITNGTTVSDITCFEGRDAVLNKYFPTVMENVREFGFDVDTILCDGDRACVIGNYVGVGNTGLEFSARFCHYLTLNDGCIVNYEQIVDSAVYNRAIGKILN